MGMGLKSVIHTGMSGPFSGFQASAVQPVAYGSVPFLGHRANIFSCKFAPFSSSRRLLSWCVPQFLSSHREKVRC
jgi:hypothetical protein